jgi:3-phosphoshikimate 1-carboxyvinyltransferase
MPTVTDAPVRPARRVLGRVRVPGDKSISHRYALLAALANGRSRVHGYAPGADCAATLACLRALGVSIDAAPPPPGLTVPSITIVGRGLRGLHAPGDVLDAQNSGTTLRLLSGVLAAHPFTATLTGDESLRRRPMRRVIDPLTRMGARIDADGDRAPLTITGGCLRPIDYTPPVPSAQVKSAVLLAGLQTDGETIVREAVPTRNHTELALEAFGVRVRTIPGGVALEGTRPLHAIDATVPGDSSSATFWAVAAAALPGSDVELVDVGVNPTRTALFDVLTRAGARVDREPPRTLHGEPCGTIRVRPGDLRPVTIGPADVPGLIDELPALAAMATHGGELHVTGAGELRVKESDRISALAAGLRGLGAEVEEFPDGFHVRGARRITGGTAHAAGDHRLAMAFAIAALGAERPSIITGAEAVAVSYPGFFETLAALTGADG